MIKLLAMLSIPVVPFSFITEYFFENCKSCRDYFFPFLVFFAFFFASLGLGKAGFLLSLLAVITSVIYTYKLFKVQSVEEWVFNFFVATVSLSWLNTENMLLFILAFAVPLTVIHFLFYHLKRQGVPLNFKELTGIGSYLPKFSALLFLALVSALVIAPAYAFFLNVELIKGNLLLALIFVAEWIAWNWVGFKLFPNVIFGEPKEINGYRDIETEEAFPLTFTLLAILLLPLV
ncbi:hypothetical protein JCM9492_17290 [Aquifex pyrophilus]